VVTPELFSLLRQKPLVGRTFMSEDGGRGAAAVAILSEGLWRGHFAADPDIIGSSIALDTRAFTIVGVMPSTFRFPLLTGEQIWIPLAQDPLFSGWMEERKGHWLQVTGRLKDGVEIEQAQLELEAVAVALAKDFPAENEGWRIRAIPLQEMIVGDAKGPLLVLLGAVGLVLLIACANISNLLLTRATSRAREIAVRTSLGAGRARIVRQLLSEALVLGALGGAAGVGVAVVGVRILTSLLPSNLPLVNPVEVDAWVLGFAVLLSLVAACTFGLAPAWFSADARLRLNLQGSSGRTSESRGRRGTRSLLAAAEVALAMVLLVAAGLLLRSFAKLTSVSPGFAVEQLVLADISLPRFQYSTPAQWVTFADAFLAGLHSDPALRNSAVAVPRPIADVNLNLAFDIPGRAPAAAGASRTADYVSVSPGYFRVMQIPLMAGRMFEDRDVAATARVSISQRGAGTAALPERESDRQEADVRIPA
jgi:predicted permease